MRHPKCVCTRFQPNPALHHHQALMAVQSILGLRKTTRILSTSNPKIFKAMRKSFIYAAGLICLALTLTNCQKESIQQESPASETNFELFAHPVTTKTANEGLETKWVAKDSINVFHAEAGATTYVSDGKFIVKNTETGSFDGTIKTLDASKSYDWYAFYPYSSYNMTPAGVSKATFGYTTIGGKSQTQTSNNSRAHLSGKACPLYGIASNVAYDKTPSIAMNHLTSVIKVAVTNNSGEDLTVSSVSFTGTEDIVGTYYINFADSPIAYASTGDKYVSSTASLSVSKGEAIANGSSADFYIAIKPFTAKSGSTLKLAVNGYEKTITLDKDITFTAGQIKPLNFNYDKKPVSGAVVTYQHIFNSKPSTGNDVILSGVSWAIEASNLQSYNSSSYAGVQFGTKKKSGEIKLTSSSAWSYNSAKEIKEVRIWLNSGGATVTPSVMIGDKVAVSDGTEVVKNKDAATDWTKTTKVTFTPAENVNTGVVVIDVKSANAGYICAIEIDCM